MQQNYIEYGRQTILTHRREGGTNIFHTHGGTNISTSLGGTNIFTSRRVLTFYVGDDGGYDDVDKEMDVSEASKLSAGDRIFRGP